MKEKTKIILIGNGIVVLLQSFTLIEYEENKIK